jgi:hypothetical protein
MKNMFTILILLVFAIGCDSPVAPEEQVVLDIYCNNCTTDEQGNLYYTYVGHKYGIIDFTVSPVSNHTLVGWTSPNEYCVDHWGQELCEPVINYQTYSDENGNGHQTFYMNELFIGQTLRLIGYLNEDIYDEIYITIK